MRGKLLGAVLAPLCVVALAGCGSSAKTSSSSASSSTSSTTASSSSSSTTTSSSSSSAASGEASKPATQILSDAAAALRSAHSYAMDGTLTQGSQHLRIKLATTSASSLDLGFAIGKATADLIGLPSASYIRGNATFWRAQAGARAIKLADHWIQVPTTNGRALTSSLGEFAPSTLSRCLSEDHGTLSLAGRATVNGQPAILLKDAGDKPGSSKSVMAVAATGTPYPLRYTALGGQRAGGRVDVCNTGKANNARGSLDFGQFGTVPPIQAPAGAIKLGSSTS